MPRAARETSASGLYHVITRGIAEQSIFLTNADRLVYLRLLQRIKTEHALTIHAYCLMDNHIHLLLAAGDERLGDTMRRIGVSYAQSFNAAYGRTGYVFQGRFRSETIENDTYFLTALRYILQNPMRAGLCQGLHDYPWNSYQEYAKGFGRVPGLVTTDLALGMMGDRPQLLEFLRRPPTEELTQLEALDVAPRPHLSDEAVCRRLLLLLPSWTESLSLASVDLTTRRRVLQQLKEMPGASPRQIARVAKIDVGMVNRA